MEERFLFNSASNPTANADKHANAYVSSFFEGNTAKVEEGLKQGLPQNMAETKQPRQQGTFSERSLFLSFSFFFFFFFFFFHSFVLLLLLLFFFFVFFFC